MQDFKIPEPVRRRLEEYNKCSQINTDHNIVFVQSLGVSILDDLSDMEHFRSVEGDVKFYNHPSLDGGVLMFANGAGYCCADSIRQLWQVESWFREGFEKFAESSERITVFD